MSDSTTTTEQTQDRDQFPITGNPIYEQFEQRRIALRKRMDENMHKRDVLASRIRELENKDTGSVDLDELLFLMQDAEEGSQEWQQIKQETQELRNEAEGTGYLEALVENSVMPFFKLVVPARGLELGFATSQSPEGEQLTFYSDSENGGGEHWHTHLTPEEGAQLGLTILVQSLRLMYADEEEVVPGLTVNDLVNKFKGGMN